MVVYTLNHVPLRDVQGEPRAVDLLPLVERVARLGSNVSVSCPVASADTTQPRGSINRADVFILICLSWGDVDEFC